uniref:Telomeric repeat-binding factor 2-interacting protein 1 n=1 Tax=Seriola lalandi dorsalis TaxID=1841481 RepID=A0A3B4XWT2_SERLL
MPLKEEDVAKSNISSVLFMTAEGEPMSFFLRPGLVKSKLQPLITSGGGMLCNVQQPGAILLIDPEERGSLRETTAHWYVSTQYIYDCIEKEERLNIEEYRLNPEVVPRHSARLFNNYKEGFFKLLGGRAAYTPEEDAAILNYVSNHKSETGGNRLWQAMEKQCVTSHSWQSMKYRYKVQLAKKKPEVEKVKTAEGEIKDSLQSLPNTPTPKNTKQPKQRASPELEQPQRRLTRTHLELELSSSPQPYSKKLRSSSTSPEKLSSSPQPVNNTKSAVKLAAQKHTDLASVTKALLKTSGDFSAALDLLLDPSSISGPFWNRRDDSLLLSADPVVLLHLQEKYSEEEVAKRIVFLEKEKQLN